MLELVVVSAIVALIATSFYLYGAFDQDYLLASIALLLAFYGYKFLSLFSIQEPKPKSRKLKQKDPRVIKIHKQSAKRQPKKCYESNQISNPNVPKQGDRKFKMHTQSQSRHESASDN